MHYSVNPRLQLISKSEMRLKTFISYPVNITCIIAHFEPSEYFYEYSLPLPSIHHPWSEYSLPLASKLGQVAIV